MVEQIIDQNEARSRSSLFSIAPGPTRILRSSASLPWHGILLERHLCSPGERTSASIDQHVVSLFERAPACLEHRGRSASLSRSPLALGPS